MKIIRQTAPDMRQALRAVRERLGADAVILSSRRIENGVEVRAAIDFDAESLQAQASAPELPSSVVAVSNAPRAAAADQPSSWTDAAFARAAQVAPGAQTEVDTLAANREAHQVDAMGRELKTLRRMLETQLAHLTWSNLSRRAPVHAEMLRELTEVGLSQDLAAQVVSRLPTNIELTPARALAIAELSQRLPVTGDRWLENGGRVALIGPTGVGKTTALAKLAVRWALKHGAHGLALVAADTMRIGAQEHMQALGQLLGAPVHRLDDLAMLPALLERLGQHSFVLIDTPGCAQRDTQLVSRLRPLAAAPQVETALVLSTSTQAGALEEITKRFGAANPTSCLLTKLDEAASLGGVLSTVMRARLPVSYVSDGQRIPEDLRPARALDLVTSAVQLARTSGAAADEDLLRRRFGELAHAIA